MSPRLSSYLQGLHAEGLVHDAAQADRLRRRRNLELPGAELLALVVRIAAARRVVEIGTANGYSTIWLADALCDTDGQLESIDVAPAVEARANLIRADAIQPGLVARVAFRQGDGGTHLVQLASGSVDLLFLDAERVEYPLWWPHPVRVLRTGGVLAIDNVQSHADEVAPFLALLAADPALVGTTLAVGKGLHVVWHRALRRNSAPRQGGTQ